MLVLTSVSVEARDLDLKDLMWRGKKPLQSCRTPRKAAKTACECMFKFDFLKEMGGKESTDFSEETGVSQFEIIGRMVRCRQATHLNESDDVR